MLAACWWEGRAVRQSAAASAVGQWGGAAAVCFVAWRIWTWLGLGYAVQNAKEAVNHMRETYAKINDAIAEFWEREDKWEYLPEDMNSIPWLDWTARGCRCAAGFWPSLPTD